MSSHSFRNDCRPIPSILLHFDLLLVMLVCIYSFGENIYETRKCCVQFMLHLTLKCIFICKMKLSYLPDLSASASPSPFFGQTSAFVDCLNGNSSSNNSSGSSNLKPQTLTEKQTHTQTHKYICISLVIMVSFMRIVQCVWVFTLTKYCYLG